MPHGEPVDVWIELETGEIRGDLRQLENWTPPRQLDGRLVGEASFELPARPAAGLPHAAGLVRREASMPLIVTPAWVGFPARMGDRRAWGVADPALQRPLGSSPGASATWATWRISRCGRPPSTAPASCWSTRCTPPSRGRRWSRRPTCRPPAASSTRSTCGWSASPSSPTSAPAAGQGRHAPESASKVRLAAVDRDRPERCLDREAQGARRSSSRCRGRRAGRPRSPAYRRREGRGLQDFATWCVLSEAHGPDWREWPAELQRPGVAGGAPPSRGARRPGRLLALAAVGAGRAAGVGPAGRRCGPGWHSG